MHHLEDHSKPAITRTPLLFTLNPEQTGGEVSDITITEHPFTTGGEGERQRFVSDPIIITVHKGRGAHGGII